MTYRRAPRGEYSQKKRRAPITGKIEAKRRGEVSRQPPRPRIIHYPGWPPPEAVLGDARRELDKPNRRTASDVEAMAYLSSASLSAPLSDQWCRIYFYLARKYLRGKGWKNFKAMKFLDEHKTLREGDERELRRLKSWIYEQQMGDLAERRRTEKTGGRAEA
jgi:hypothetical protein